MRQNPSFTLADSAAIKDLIRAYPWVTLVSDTSAGLVASHYPVLVDESRSELSVVTHLGRPDDLVHELGAHELLMIVQGPHGYISSSWYGEADVAAGRQVAPQVPTWNYIAAHLRGVPEILSAEENVAVLGALVDHFERPLPAPRAMLGTRLDAAYAERLQSGTVGIRLTPSSVTGKAKLSQNKAEHVVDRVLLHLDGDGPYAQPELAARMRAARPMRA